jgi:hypothetical protein
MIAEAKISSGVERSDTVNTTLRGSTPRPPSRAHQEQKDDC